jgi:hypothetical protein
MEYAETGGSEDRLAALEKKSAEMEVLVKVLITELLDCKAVAMTLCRETKDERDRHYLQREPAGQDTSFPIPAEMPLVTPNPAPCETSRGIQSMEAPCPDSTAAPKEPEMVRIMQSDGTMKLEPRYGDAQHIDSSGEYGSHRKDNSARSRQNPLIYAAGKDRPDPAKG